MTVVTMQSTIVGRTLAQQLGLNHYVARKNAEGITHEESLVQPSPGGNCMNWVLGHVVSSRGLALGLLGEEPAWEQRHLDRYSRGSAPVIDGHDTPPFGEILAALDRSQEAFLRGLERISEERLAEKAPFSPVGNPDETIGSLLASLVFHDSYHIGQTGVLRRIIGKEGSLK